MEGFALHHQMTVPEFKRTQYQLAKEYIKNNLRECCKEVDGFHSGKGFPSNGHNTKIMSMLGGCPYVARTIVEEMAVKVVAHMD